MKTALNRPISSAESHEPTAREPKKLPQPVYAVTPFTLLDFPDKVACIVWFAGCNLRCPYCHNPQIIRSRGCGKIEDVLEFLCKRRGLLDGVVLSGGEAAAFPDIVPFAESVRRMGYIIKLDTNGTHPSVVSRLLQRELVDYIALDYKAPPEKFRRVTGTGKFHLFEETLDFLCRQDKIPFEIRTTVHTDLLDESDINQIVQDLDGRGYQGTYYIQNFIHSSDRPTFLPLPSQKRLLDPALILQTDHFDIAYRNFRESS